MHTNEKMPSTGEKIQSIRNKQNMSQYELADKVKILNQSQISKIESGSRKVTDRDLVAIAKALDVPVIELLQIGQ